MFEHSFHIKLGV